MDWVFFADDIYKAINGILYAIFNTLYGDFSDGLKLFVNLFFHIFVVFYAFMSFKNGYFSSLLSLFRSILLLTGTFNLSFNSTYFKEYIYDFVMNFPIKFASYLVNSTISANIPNFKSPSEFNTSKLFASLTTTLATRLESTFQSRLGASFPTTMTIYLGVVIALVIIVYYIFWLIQFGFLIQAAIYLILGIPIIILLSFRETQHIFFEWLRAVITIMLHPVMAAIVIYIILNFIEPLSSDAETVLNANQVGLSAIGTLFAAVVFGIFALRYIPSMAAILTRGSMAAADSPLKSAIRTAPRALGTANSLRKGMGTVAGKISQEISKPSPSIGQSSSGGGKGGSENSHNSGASGGIGGPPVFNNTAPGEDSIQTPSGQGASGSHSNQRNPAPNTDVSGTIPSGPYFAGSAGNDSNSPASGDSRLQTSANSSNRAAPVSSGPGSGSSGGGSNTYQKTPGSASRPSVLDKADSYASTVQGASSAPSNPTISVSPGPRETETDADVNSVRSQASPLSGVSKNASLNSYQSKPTRATVIDTPRSGHSGSSISGAPSKPSRSSSTMPSPTSNKKSGDSYHYDPFQGFVDNRRINDDSPRSSKRPDKDETESDSDNNSTIIDK